MTSELRPAVEVWLDAYEASYYDEVDDDQAAAAVIEADREAVRAGQDAEIERLNIRLAECSAAGSTMRQTVEELHAEREKWKALAETLAGALHHRGGPLCPARYYGDAQCTCGVADVLTSYKEQRDA